MNHPIYTIKTTMDSNTAFWGPICPQAVTEEKTEKKAISNTNLTRHSTHQLRTK